VAGSAYITGFSSLAGQQDEFVLNGFWAFPALIFSLLAGK
jgi:hypothetical protein